MGRGAIPPIRALPRVFLPGVDLSEAVELPKLEADKFRKVLRLGTGDYVAVLPNDGSLVICQLEGRSVRAVERVWPQTEPERAVTLAQALPATNKLETILRMGTEVGAHAFILFPSERTVVRWDAAKKAEKLPRLEAIVREAAEQSFRCRLPAIRFQASLAEVLETAPNAIVLSEREGVRRPFNASGPTPKTLVVGPEGGWSPSELDLIGERGVTLGPRVLRADTCGPIALGLALLGTTGSIGD